MSVWFKKKSAGDLKELYNHKFVIGRRNHRVLKSQFRKIEINLPLKLATKLGSLGLVSNVS